MKAQVLRPWQTTVNRLAVYMADHCTTYPAPGLQAHPHKHGSTMLQTITSSFAIVVEDDHDKWLPKANGCSEGADAHRQWAQAKEIGLYAPSEDGYGAGQSTYVEADAPDWR